MKTESSLRRGVSKQVKRHGRNGWKTDYFVNVLTFTDPVATNTLYAAPNYTHEPIASLPTFLRSYPQVFTGHDQPVERRER
jgi:hypothetical protein